MFIDLPPQVNGLSQLDHWQGNCGYWIRTNEWVFLSRGQSPVPYHLAKPHWSAFSDRTSVYRIRHNLISIMMLQSTLAIDHLCTDSVTLSRLIAGDRFEPPFLRVWTLWDSASPSCRNPDSRVSKVFNVLCLNTRRFGLRQRRLYGRAPLHGLNSTVQLYALTRRYAAMH